MNRKLFNFFNRYPNAMHLFFQDQNTIKYWVEGVEGMPILHNISHMSARADFLGISLNGCGAVWKFKKISRAPTQ